MKYIYKVESYIHLKEVSEIENRMNKLASEGWEVVSTAIESGAAETFNWRSKLFVTYRKES